MRRPILWLVAVTGILIFVGLPFTRLEPGRIDEKVLPEGTAARVGVETIEAKLSWPNVNPIQVVARGVDSSDTETIAAFTSQTLELDGVSRVYSSIGYVREDGSVPPNNFSRHYAPSDADSDAGTWFDIIYQLRLEDDRVEGLVDSLRNMESPAGELLVGGNDASVIDTVDVVTSRVPAAMGVIAVVTLVLLFFMTGSVVVPIKAVLLNLLSLTATMGALVWVFQDGHLADQLGVTVTGKIDVFTPILMFCIAFGLSMDYEVFLLARIKEEYDLTDDNDHAVRVGIGRTGPVVTAAAVLLAIVFLAIATSGVVIVKMFGLGLAVAVITDAFLVRATLTPALMKVAGRANWWAPGPLRRFHLRWGIWETDPMVVPGAVTETIAKPSSGGS